MKIYTFIWQPWKELEKINLIILYLFPLTSTKSGVNQVFVEIRGMVEIYVSCGKLFLVKYPMEIHIFTA